ncbi:MAG: uroporphyrinogen-III synthase [Rickettsiales bacterium]|nr:uroporphyrinogen-III synthase [Rickettsiales bacterium]
MDQTGVTALILRPKEDAEQTVEQLSAIGIRSVMSPLLTIIPCPDSVSKWREVAKDSIELLIVTSANAIRMFADITDDRDLPLVTVGSNTAEIAKKLGFKNVQSADGNIENLKDFILEQYKEPTGAFVYLCGTVVSDDSTAFLRDKNYSASSIEVYEALPVKKIDPVIINDLKNGVIDAILFHSARTAEIFSQIVKKAKLKEQFKSISIFCISQKVADEVASFEWKKVYVAASPNGDAMIQSLNDYAKTDKTEDFLEDEIGLEKISLSNTISNTDSPTKIASKSVRSKKKKSSTDQMKETKGQDSSNQELAGSGVAAPDNSTLVMLLVLTWVILGAGSVYALYVSQRSITELEHHDRRIQVLEKLTENISYDSHLIPAAKPDESLEVLTKKIEALESQISEGAVLASKQQDQREEKSLEELFEVVAIQAQLQMIDSRVNEIEGTLRSRISVSLRHSEILIALLELRKIIQEGKPFKEQLEKALQAASDEASVSLQLSQLEPYAAKGIQNIESLRKEFVRLIPSITQASTREELVEGGNSLKMTLNNLVTVRRVGQVEGDSTEAIIARAELALEHGYIEDVVMELEKLEGQPASLIALWLNEVRAILEVQKKYEQIHRHITDENTKVREAYDTDKRNTNASDDEKPELE